MDDLFACGFFLRATAEKDYHDGVLIMSGWNIVVPGNP